MSYLAKSDAAAAAERWPMVRDWLYREPEPLFAELRRHRPVLSLSELDFCTSHADCTLILRRHQSFSVALNEPKRGSNRSRDGARNRPPGSFLMPDLHPHGDPVSTAPRRSRAGILRLGQVEPQRIVRLTFGRTRSAFATAPKLYVLAAGDVLLY